MNNENKTMDDGMYPQWVICKNVYKKNYPNYPDLHRDYKAGEILYEYVIPSFTDRVVFSERPGQEPFFLFPEDAIIPVN